jgi:hypothetical protein
MQRGGDSSGQMSETHTSTEDHHEPGVYEIRVKGHLDTRWTDWFEGLTTTLEDSGDSLLTGPVVDQAALHGVLRRVRDLGLPLVSVIQVNPTQANGPDVNADTGHHRSNKETDV